MDTTGPVLLSVSSWQLIGHGEGLYELRRGRCARPHDDVRELLVGRQRCLGILPPGHADVWALPSHSTCILQQCDSQGEERSRLV